MDITMIAGFVAFFAMIVAWMAAPTHVKRPVVAIVEPVAVGAD